MKTKKIILAVSLAAVVVLCYFIGMNLYPEGAPWRTGAESGTAAEKTGGEMSQQDNSGSDVGEISTAILSRSISFQHAAAAEDNPWGLTAGIVNVNGFCIFLTPGTGAIVTLDENEGPSSFELLLHPQVASASDGAGVEIEILDADGALIRKAEERVKEGTMRFDLQEEEIPSCRKIVFQCNNGGQGNSDADWLLIREI